MDEVVSYAPGLHHHHQPLTRAVFSLFYILDTHDCHSEFDKMVEVVAQCSSFSFTLVAGSLFTTKCNEDQRYHVYFI